MITRSNSVYAPYGAYEMKATYQRNLTAAMLVTVGAVLCIVAAGAMWPEGSAVVVAPPKDPVTVRLRPIPPPSVSYNRPNIDPGRPAAPAAVTSRPVPVPDSLFAGDPELVIAAPSEISALIGPGVGEGDFNGVIGDTGSSEGEFVAEPGVFVFLEIQPTLIDQYQGEYPRLAAMIGDEGKVTIHVLVDEQGQGIESRIAKSSGIESLDEAALAWGLKCRFSPGVQNGRPVKVWVTFDYRFKLDE